MATIELNLRQEPSVYKNWRWWAQVAAWFVILSFFTMAAGWTAAWWASHHRQDTPAVTLIPPVKYRVPESEQIIQDQRTYIDGGCNGRYQGAGS